MITSFLRLSPLVFAIAFITGCTNAPYKKLRKKCSLTTFQREAVIKDVKKQRSHKSINEMNAQELHDLKANCEKINRPDMVVKINDRLSTLTDDTEEKAFLLLESADIELSKALFEAAQKRYETFVTLYPGSNLIKKARCHQIYAHLWNADTVDRDMLEVIAATNHARSYLKDYADDTEYSEEVHAALNECFIMRFEHELGIVRFYLVKYYRTHQASSLKAAYQRLYSAQEEYLELLSLYNKNLEPFIEKITSMHACSDLLFKSDEELDEGESRPSGEACAEALEKVINEFGPALHPQKPVHPRDTF